MAKMELNAFQRTLGSRGTALENDNSGGGALVMETNPDDSHRMQRADHRDWAVGNLEHNSSRLCEVRNTLVCIDGSRFGVRVGCEENMKPKRLGAYRWASVCVVCQEAAEKTSRGQIDASRIMAA